MTDKAQEARSIRRKYRRALPEMQKAFKSISTPSAAKATAFGKTLDPEVIQRYFDLKGKGSSKITKKAAPATRKLGGAPRPAPKPVGKMPRKPRVIVSAPSPTVN